MERLSKCKSYFKDYIQSLLVGSAVLIGITAVVASIHASVVMALAFIAISLILYIIYRS